MDEKSDPEQNASAEEEPLQILRWNIIQLIYETNTQKDIFKYADQIYQYVINGQADSN